MNKEGPLWSARRRRKIACGGARCSNRIRRSSAIGKAEKGVGMVRTLMVDEAHGKRGDKWVIGISVSILENRRVP